MRRLFFPLFIAAVGAFTFSQLGALGQPVWRRHAGDLETRTLTRRSGFSTITISAIRVSPDKIHIASGALLNARDWAKKTGARAAINGAYFDEADKPLGLRIGSGKRFNKLRTGVNWGVFYIRDGRAQIRHTRDYVGSSRTREAIQCGPRLVVNGETTDLKQQWARRTGIGIDRGGKVVLAVSDGALSFDDWAQIWASKSGLNCRDALNLDGGGSTQMWLEGKSPQFDVRGAWRVPDAVVIQ